MNTAGGASKELSLTPLKKNQNYMFISAIEFSIVSFFLESIIISKLE